MRDSNSTHWGSELRPDVEGQYCDACGGHTRDVADQEYYGEDGVFCSCCEEWAEVPKGTLKKFGQLEEIFKDAKLNTEMDWGAFTLYSDGITVGYDPETQEWGLNNFDLVYQFSELLIQLPIQLRRKRARKNNKKRKYLITTYQEVAV